MDYTGKTDRELLIEIYTDLKHTNSLLVEHDCCIENISGEVEDIRGDINKGKGALAVVLIILTIISAKIVGFLSG